jgi:hypothetical protein
MLRIDAGAFRPCSATASMSERTADRNRAGTAIISSFAGLER